MFVLLNFKSVVSKPIIIIVQNDNNIFTIIMMIINFQGETSLTSSLPLTSPSDVLPNTPTINRCAWNFFNLNTLNTFLSNYLLNGQHQHDSRRVDEPDEPASKHGQHPLPTQHQPQHTGEQESIQTNKQHEIIMNDSLSPKLENGQPSRVRVPQGELMLLYLPQVVK